MALTLDYLEDLAAELMPYGLHTFDQVPAGELLDLFVDSIVAFDSAGREASWEEIRQALLLTTNEITNLLRALRGEYIEPGLGRDPVRIPDALPTGRNIVAFDPRCVPDAVAWKIGKAAADQLLERFYRENGHWPDTVGVVLWGIETMRTQGETVALVLRLVGAEPTWDKQGRVKEAKITSLENLEIEGLGKRPRVNVLLSISGLFRDTFYNLVELLDGVFRQIALLDENPEQNRVHKSYLALREAMLNQGFSAEEAEDLAASRIFGPPPGTYGAGVADLIRTTTAWDNTQDVVDTYLERMSHLYSKKTYGEASQKVFKELLKSVEAVTQVRDSLWEVIDNDDVAQYLGGLKLAAEAMSGKRVEAYIANTRQAGNPRHPEHCRICRHGGKEQAFKPEMD